MTKINLQLEKRQITGKKVAKLRRDGILPANIFGKNAKSLSVQLKLTLFKTIWKQAGETQIVYVQLPDEKETRPTLITNVQLDPITDELLHVDFRQVDLKEKITANIPVEIVGEAPAIKELQASLVTSLSEIEVEALPTDLPEKFIVDAGKLLNIGDVIKVSDLDIDRSKIEVKDDPETVIVTVAEQQKEEVAPPPAPEVEGEAAEAPSAEEGVQAETPAPTKKEEKSA